MLKLAYFEKGRDNNLNLIRIAAASTVLLSHSYVIATGDRHSEPWIATLNMSPGGLAVDAFFTLSGYLVSASLDRGRLLATYLKARALRIYPALWVELLLCTVLVGMAFTSLPWTAFFEHRETWEYLLRNGFMITGGQAMLPGAFSGNPVKGHINGSLWTLRWELRYYVLLAFAWWAAGRICRDGARPRVFKRASIVAALILTLAALLLPLLDRTADAARIGATFCWGVAYWFNRSNVQLKGKFAAAAAASMALAAVVGPHAFEWVYRFFYPYLLMYIAFVPSGPIRLYNRFGDYSYGIYVYAFPVQQAVVALHPGISTWTLSAIASPTTVLLGVLSWHLIEKPVLTWHQAARRHAADRA